MSIVGVNFKAILRRALFALALSLVCAETLAVVFVAGLSSRAGLEVFTMPGVLRVALFGGFVIALVLTPLAFWSLRTGPVNLRRYVPVLWAILALLAFVSAALGGAGTFPIVVLAAVVGLLTLSGLPPQSQA